jgi:hypothetical protein
MWRFRRRCIHYRPISLQLAAAILYMTPVAAKTRDFTVSRGSSAPLASSSLPPDYVDQYHVPNGCYISALAYIAKFKTAFPEERAEPLTVVPRRGGSPGEPHTVALITWRGRWWLRDEYFGIKSVRLPVSSAITPERIAARVAGICGQDSMTQIQVNNSSSDVAPELSFTTRMSDVFAAAAVIRSEAAVYVVHSGAMRIPMLYFQPGPGLVAVYDPTHGTAFARSNTADALKVLPAMAQKLGYKVISIDRVENPQGQRLAQAE